MSKQYNMLVSSKDYNAKGMAYAIAPAALNHHQHQCKHCESIWEHHDNCSELATINMVAFKQAHRCPKCNRPSFDKYQGRTTCY
jgi:hypothetical protein